MQGERVFDLAIVGAGILGASAAYHAVRAGKRVVLCEAGAHANGATVRNFGQIVPSGQRLGVWRHFGARTLAHYLALKEHADIPVVQRGSLYVASDEQEAALLEVMHALNRETGYRSKLLNARECLAHMPELQSSYVVAGLSYPDELSSDSPRLIPAIVRWLEQQQGFSYRSHTLIASIDHDKGGCILVTADGQRVRSRQALVCCGHFLNRLFPEELRAAKLRISKLQMMCTRSLPQVKLGSNLLTGLTIRRYEAFESCPSHSKLTTPARFQQYRDFGIHVLFKQNTDGSIIVGDSHEYFDSDQVDSLDYRIDAHINQLILSEAQRILKLPDWTMAQYWNGYYSQHDERHIYICAAWAPRFTS
jgi:FAD dependent oxidoreductase TIGR03364